MRERGWVVPGAPRASACAREGAQVQLQPTHLPLLLHLGDCLAASRAAGAAAAASPAPAGAAPEPEPPAARSFIEGMLAPDTTAFATEFIARSWGYGQAGEGGPEEGAAGPGPPAGGAAGAAPAGAASSVFVDAHSVLGSFRSGFSSFAAATAASLRDSVPRPGPSWGAAAPGAGGGPAGSAALAAGADEDGAWQLRVRTRDLSAVLWYPDAPGVPGLQARGAGTCALNGLATKAMRWTGSACAHAGACSVSRSEVPLAEPLVPGRVGPGPAHAKRVSGTFCFRSMFLWQGACSGAASERIWPHWGP